MPSQRVPKYRHHKARNLGVCTLDGRDHYFPGPHNSPISRGAYDQLIQRWLAGGRQLVDPTAPASISINELILLFYEHCEKRYARRASRDKRLWLVRRALKPLRLRFGLLPAAEFGPRSLAQVQQLLIEEGLGIASIRERIQIIRRAFRWGESQELLQRGQFNALSTLDGIQIEDQLVPAPREVRPAPLKDVRAVQQIVLPPVAAMIDVQLLTGCRPGEACGMIARDLDMSGDLWEWQPRTHKNAHRGIARRIMIGPRCQAVIRPFLLVSLDEPLFRPDVAERERDRLRRVERRTPRWPSHMRRRPRTRPKRVPRGHYDTVTYARAIRRACERLGLERWTPNQLRHTYATEIRQQYGAETARILLGHRHLKTTEIYAEADSAVMAEIAAKVG